MSRFRVGDIVTGKEDNGYGRTTEDAIMRVEYVDECYYIKVKIIEHKKYKEEIGKTYSVVPSKFELVSKAEEKPKMSAVSLERSESFLLRLKGQEYTLSRGEVEELLEAILDSIQEE